MIKQIGILAILIMVSGCDDSSTYVEYRDVYHDDVESSIAGASSTGSGGSTSTTTSINTGGTSTNLCPMLGTTPTTCFKDIVKFPAILDVCVPYMGNGRDGGRCSSTSCSNGTRGCQIQITTGVIDWTLTYVGDNPLPRAYGIVTIEKIIGEITYLDNVYGNCTATFPSQTKFVLHVDGRFNYNSDNKAIIEYDDTLVPIALGGEPTIIGSIENCQNRYTQVFFDVKSQNNLQCAECDSSCAQNIACVNKS